MSLRGATYGREAPACEVSISFPGVSSWDRGSVEKGRVRREGRKRVLLSGWITVLSILVFVFVFWGLVCFLKKG